MVVRLPVSQEGGEICGLSADVLCPSYVRLSKLRHRAAALRSAHDRIIDVKRRTWSILPSAVFGRDWLAGGTPRHAAHIQSLFSRPGRSEETRAVVRTGQLYP